MASAEGSHDAISGLISPVSVTSPMCWCIVWFRAWVKSFSKVAGSRLSVVDPWPRASLSVPPFLGCAKARRAKLPAMVEPAPTAAAPIMKSRRSTFRLDGTTRPDLVVLVMLETPCCLPTVPPFL